MRKTFLIVFGLFLLVTGRFTFATSGACSGHGGVLCAAGSAPDGSAICSDGTTSSVPYLLMAECGSSIPYGSCIPSSSDQEWYVEQYKITTPEKQESIIQYLQSSIDEDNQEISYDNQQLQSDIDSSQTNWQSVIQSDQDQVTYYQSEKSKALSGAGANYDATHPRSSNELKQSYLDSVSKEYDSNINLATNELNTAQDNLNKEISNDKSRLSTSSISNCISQLNNTLSTIKNWIPPTPATITKQISSQTVLEAKKPEVIVPTDNSVTSIPINDQVKLSFWGKVKNLFSKLKFW